MAYAGSFELNGVQHDFAQRYDCYFERLAPGSAQGGPTWHVRSTGNVLRVEGALPAGGRYFVQPIRPDVGGAPSCDEIAQPAPLRLFLSLPDGRLESFDRPGSSARHRVDRLVSGFVLRQVATAPFRPAAEWPVDSVPIQTYYTLWVSEYAADNWSDPAGAGLAAWVRGGHLPVLMAGRRYPFSAWTEADVQFARSHRGALRWPVLRAPLSPEDGQDEVWRQRAADRVLWAPEPPLPAGMAAWHPAAQTAVRRWVEYRGAQIEVPLGDYYRLLHDPVRDRLVLLRAERVQLR